MTNTTRRKKKRKKIVLSQGEARCGVVLKELGLEPTSQYRIQLLPRYRFDYHFIFQDREYLVEFDGQQHFGFTSWFHRSQRSFEKKRERDFLKSTVALMSGYHLIRIAYNDLAFFEDILRDALRGEKRLYFSNDQMYEYLATTKIPPVWFHQYGQHLLPLFTISKEIASEAPILFEQTKRRVKIVHTSSQ